MSRFHPKFAAAVLAAVFWPATLPAQDARPHFEAAVIQPAGDLSDGFRTGKHIGTRIDNAQIDIGYATLLGLICTAYSVKAVDVLAPDWISTAYFNVRATFPAGATKSDVPEMLQSLLEERLKLVVRRTSEPQPVYALVVARTGAKLKPSTGDPPTPLPAAPTKNQLGNGPATGVWRNGNSTLTLSDGLSHVETIGITMREFSESLGDLLHKQVFDQTGLEGKYDLAYELAWSDTSTALATPGAAVPFTTLFDSLRKLGLALEPRRVPLARLVIDRVARTPTGN
jgi:uncharacterized protein (TIGR03435 family)